MRGKKRRNLRFTGKIIVYTAAFVYAFIILLGVVLYFGATGRINEVNADSFRHRTDYLKESIDMEVLSYEKPLRYLIIDRTLSENLNRLSRGDEPVETSRALRNGIRPFSASYPYPAEIRLYCASVNLVAFRPLHYMSEAEGEGWYELLRSDTYNHIHWEYRKSDGNGMFPHGTLSCFCGVNGRRDCYIKFTVSADFLFDVIRKYTEDTGEAAMILTSQAEPVYANENTTEELLLAAQEYLRYGKEEGESARIRSWNIRKLGMDVVVFPADTAERTYIGFSRYSLTAFAAILGISALLLPLFANLLTRRLRTLNSRVCQVDGDHLNYTDDIGGSDEITELSHSFAGMVSRMTDMIERTKAMERERFDLEFKALQDQISPHFLFNSLSVINSMAAEIEAEDICRSITALAQFYRLSLNEGRTTITVGDEITMLRCYIEILSVRYSHDLAVEIDIEDGAEKCVIPKMMLQPLLENSAFHAFYPEIEGKPTIWLEIYRENGRLICSVTDNGNGIPEEKLRLISNGAGIATKNIDERLKLLYGSEYGLTITSRVGEGTQARIEIPERYDPGTDVPGIPAE